MRSRLRWLLLLALGLVAGFGYFTVTSKKVVAAGNCGGGYSCEVDLNNIDCCTVVNGYTLGVGTSDVAFCDPDCYVECDSTCDGSCSIAIWEHQTGANPRRAIVWQ